MRAALQVTIGLCAAPARALLPDAPLTAARPSPRQLIDEFQLRRPVETAAASPAPERAASAWAPERAAAEAFVVSGDAAEATVPSVAIVDSLVDDALRRDLLALLGECDDVVEAGPSASAWTRGAFVDHADELESASDSLGLRPHLLDALTAESPAPAALVELQTRLQSWFSHANDADVTVTRIPSFALGDAAVPALAANAPVAGSDGTFEWHVDADPLDVPPSPWRDAYGCYANRAPRRGYTRGDGSRRRRGCDVDIP